MFLMMGFGWKKFVLGIISLLMDCFVIRLVLGIVEKFGIFVCYKELLLVDWMVFYVSCFDS